MANYTKATDFASKDALLTGDPNKIVKGAEIDDEFSNIQTAVNSKADLLSPTLTGTPLAPTAVAGTNTTQVATTAYVINERSVAATITNKTTTTESFGDNSTKLATTAFVQAALKALYPVGTIYTSTSSTNPASTFGFGTWEAFGAGRVLVGQDTADASFNTLGYTGGSKNAIVVTHTHAVSASGTTEYMGNHTHTLSGSTGSAGSHTHSIQQWTGTADDSQDTGGTYTGMSTSLPFTAYPAGVVISTAPSHTHSLSGTALENGAHVHPVTVTGTTDSPTTNDGTNANLQPYIVVKMWKRTA